MDAQSRSRFSVLASILWIFSGLLVRADELRPSGLTGSDFTLRSWGAAEGLPGMVRAITQTADGYLWVGTLNGLARFDGVRFETYSAANTPELFSDTINVLYESRASSEIRMAKSD